MKDKAFRSSYFLIGVQVQNNYHLKKSTKSFKEQVIDTNEGQTGLLYYLSDKGFTILKCSEKALKLRFKIGNII